MRMAEKPEGKGWDASSLAVPPDVSSF